MKTGLNNLVKTWGAVTRLKYEDLNWKTIHPNLNQRYDIDLEVRILSVCVEPDTSPPCGS